MVKTLTSKFKVETVWPELINKRIQQIDSRLKEIQFFNQGDSLLAKGSLRRQVKYEDSSGRLRKTEDKLQFEVIIGAALPEPLPYFSPELKSDYFIFQPRRLGENHASLEQGFILTVTEFEADIEDPGAYTILASEIVGKGKEETVYCFPLDLKRDCRPKAFNGNLIFERGKPPVITGTISGVITYRNSRQILKELEVNHSFSVLPDSAPKGSGGELIATGIISGVDWIPPSGGQGWLAEFKLDYNWNLSVNKELTVLGKTEPFPSASGIKAKLLIGEQQLQFTKSFKAESDNDERIEAESEIQLLTWRRLGSGLLISAVLNFGLFQPDVTGMEKYRVLNFDIEELTEGFFDDINSPDLTLELEPKNTIVKTITDGSWIVIDSIVDINVKVYQPRLIYLTQENTVTEINGLIPATEQSFALLNETMLDFGHPPQRIIKVCNRLLQTNPSTKKGWLNLSGITELEVIYLDRQNQYREENFRLFFQKSFCWEGIKANSEYQIDLSSTLEYDSYRIQGNRFFYKYLWNFSAAAFVKQTVKVGVSPGKRHITPLDTLTLPIPITIEELSFKGEIPLNFGNPKEISSGRGLITEFNWRNALNAVLVEGKIKGEIEYWDESGFLRRETVSFSFWRFLTQSQFGAAGSILVPTLRRFNYVPLKPWPWGRGAVSYEVEIEITNKRNEGE